MFVFDVVDSQSTFYSSIICLVLSVSCVTTFALKITLFYVEFSIIFNVSFNNDYIYDILYEKFEDNKIGKQKPKQYNDKRK